MHCKGLGHNRQAVGLNLQCRDRGNAGGAASRRRERNSRGSMRSSAPPSSHQPINSRSSRDGRDTGTRCASDTLGQHLFGRVLGHTRQHLQHARQLFLGVVYASSDSLSDLGEQGLDSRAGLDVSDSDFVHERGSARVLGVIDAVVSEVGSQSRVGPGEVRGVSLLVVLVADHLDHFVSVGRVVGLDDVVLDEPVSKFGIVPAGEDGGLGFAVVLRGAKSQQRRGLEVARLTSANKAEYFSRERSAASELMTPSDTSHCRMLSLSHPEKTVSLASQ